jgi:hypothetical protein
MAFVAKCVTSRPEFALNYSVIFGVPFEIALLNPGSEMQEPIHSLLIVIQLAIEEDRRKATDLFDESLGIDTYGWGLCQTLQDRWRCREAFGILPRRAASARFSSSYGLLMYFD